MGEIPKWRGAKGFLLPCREFESFESAEFTDVGGDEGSVQTAGVGGNQQIQWADGDAFFLPGQIALLLLLGAGDIGEVGGVGVLVVEVGRHVGECFEHGCRPGTGNNLLASAFDRNLGGREAKCLGQTHGLTAVMMEQFCVYLRYKCIYKREQIKRIGRVTGRHVYGRVRMPGTWDSSWCGGAGLRPAVWARGIRWTAGVDGLTLEAW